MRQLERDTGLTVSNISLLANHKTGAVGFNSLLKIAVALEVDVGDIIKVHYINE